MRAPRLSVAIERIGGPDVVREALAPKFDADEKPLKWAAVCAQEAEGLPPGDPMFAAWLRLAATPVREVKAAVRAASGEFEDPRRRGGRRSGPRREGRPREERIGRDELNALGRDGQLNTQIRIVGPGDDDRKEREARRKEQREAKRRAERERLARLGY